MENASKALIMAASVLLGVMILTITVYMFSVFSEYSENTYAKMEATQIDQFNNQFLKYYGNINYTYENEDTGKEETVNGPIKLTAHDIITISNLAQQNNKQYNLEELQSYDESMYYVQIDYINNKVKKESATNLEKWEEKAKITFINEHSNEEFMCSNVIISQITKRVCYMKFEKLINKDF